MLDRRCLKFTFDFFSEMMEYEIVNGLFTKEDVLVLMAADVELT